LQNANGGESMSVDLTGKTCVVTGAARSIGLGVSEMYCDLNASVAMIDISSDVRKQAERLVDKGHKVRGYVLDITDRDAVRACFGDIAKSLGPVFALVNCAGAVDQQPFEEISPDRLDRINRININGSIYCAQAALATMKLLQDGRIINFSSKSGKTGSALMAAYSSTKGAIIALTQALAHEFAGQNIKVNCLCPGPVGDSTMWGGVTQSYMENLKIQEDEVTKSFTGKVPLGRLCKIADIVAFVRFLSIDGDYCTGQAFNVSGGREMH
jgi:NAD(P)-dependent dehydrogenase (short-subunit alcohol dehydrogenase family)